MSPVQPATGIPARASSIALTGIPAQAPAGSPAGQTLELERPDSPPLERWHSALCAQLAAEYIGRASIDALHGDREHADTERGRAEAWFSLGRLIEAVVAGERRATIRPQHLELLDGYVLLEIKMARRSSLTPAQATRRLLELQRFRAAIVGAVVFGAL